MARSCGRATFFSTWETLKTHVPVAVNTGLSGIPYWGTDIGGFVPTPEYTGELHVRWFQFATFCPSYRAHGRTWHLRLPWGWNTGELGPQELRGYTGGAGHPDPGELRNAQVEPIIRKYLELRYRLLPYTYTIAKACCDTGLPMMRSLWIHYPRDPAAVARGDQFLWGRDILVSRSSRRGRRAAVSICRPAPGTTTGPRSGSPAAASSIARLISRRCRCTSGPAQSFRTVRCASTSASRRPIR